MLPRIKGVAAVLLVGLMSPVLGLCPAQEAKLKTTLNGHDSWVVALAFSSHGNLLASASADRTIKVWDVAT